MNFVNAIVGRKGCLLIQLFDESPLSLTDFFIYQKIQDKSDKY